MRVFISTFIGKSMEFEVGAEETTLDLKHKIQDQEGIPPSEQRLSLQSEPLPDDVVFSQLQGPHTDAQGLELVLWTRCLLANVCVHRDPPERYP